MDISLHFIYIPNTTERKKLNKHLLNLALLAPMLIQ